MPVSSRMFRERPIVPASRRKVPSTRNAGQLCPGTSDPDAPSTLILNFPALPFRSERDSGDPVPLPQPVRGRDHVERRGPADRHRDSVAYMEVHEGDIGIPVDNVVPLHPFSVLHGESAARGIEPDDRPGDCPLLRRCRARSQHQKKAHQCQEKKRPVHPHESPPFPPGRCIVYLLAFPPLFPAPRGYPWAGTLLNAGGDTPLPHPGDESGMSPVGMSPECPRCEYPPWECPRWIASSGTGGAPGSRRRPLLPSCFRPLPVVY